MLLEAAATCPSNGEFPVGAVYDCAYFVDSSLTFATVAKVRLEKRAVIDRAYRCFFTSFATPLERGMGRLIAANVHILPSRAFHSEVWITLWKTDGPGHISPRKTDVL